MIYSIGHSTRDIGSFIELLRDNDISLVVDIRSLPGSKKYPWFNRENLEKSLKEEGIGYMHLKGLGGFRKAKKDSKNNIWKNKSFRGYADYMETKDFEDGIKDLIKESKDKNAAIMCAEANPYSCHRSMVSDALYARGVLVKHIFCHSDVKKHRLKDFAKIARKKVSYR